MVVKTEGFSTLEVLVAFTILSATIALSMTSYTQGLRGLRDAQTRLDAMSLLDGFDFELPQNLLRLAQTSDAFRIEPRFQSIDDASIGQFQPKFVTLRVYLRDNKREPLLDLSTVVISPESK